MIIIYRIIISCVLAWGHYYRMVERLFISRAYRSRFYLWFSGKTALQKWEQVKALMEYQHDKWYQLFDVTSDPDFSLYRGWGDCDDYSAIAYLLFGNQTVINKKVYDYIGTFYLLYGFSGHVISIWKTDSKYMIISTEQMLFFNNLKDVFRYFNEERAIKAVANVKYKREEHIEADLKKVYKYTDSCSFLLDVYAE